MIPNTIYRQNVSAQTIQTDKIELHAEIRENDIRYGSEPFDDSDGNGFDSNDRNGLVRSFDQADYAIQTTINPIDENVHNVKIRIFGTLKNGITDNGRRVNAVFSHPDAFTVLDPAHDHRYSEAVSAIDTELTLSQTGQAISIGLPIQVSGARNNLEIQPDLTIQVLEVDGEDVSDHEYLESIEAPSFTVSSQVSFAGAAHFPNGSAGPIIGAEFAHGDQNDQGMYRMVGTSFYLVPIEGANRPQGSEMLGATFPTGRIEFEYDISGEVFWFGEDDRSLGNDPIQFGNSYGISEVVHHGEISSPQVQTHVGVSNLSWEGQSLFTNGWTLHGTGYSHLGAASQEEAPDFSSESINQHYRRSVWDSGNWSLERGSRIVNNGQDHIRQRGSVEDYVIGYTFPSIRASNNITSLVHDGWNNFTHRVPDGMGGEGFPVFATQSAVWYMPREYRTGGEGNPNESSQPNDEIYSMRVNVLGYEDEKGDFQSQERMQIANIAETTLNNRITGGPSVDQQFRGFSYDSILEDGTLTGMHDYRIADENEVYALRTTGDAQTIIGNSVLIRGSTGSGGNASEGGVDHFFQWNIETFELTEAYAKQAEIWAQQQGYTHLDMERRSAELEDEVFEIVYGVPNFENYDYQTFLNRGKDDYTWYSAYEEAARNGEIGAYMIRVFDRTGGVAQVTGQVRIPLKVNSQQLGSVNESGTYNLVSSGSYFYYYGRDQDPVATWHETESIGQPSTYNENGEFVQRQSPVGSSVWFATLGVIPGRINSEISSQQSAIYSDQSTTWKSRATIDLPNRGGEDMDVIQTLEIEHRLPQGLRYIGGSGLLFEETEVEPDITIHDDGTSTLRWQLFLPADSGNDFELTFETSVNPQGLSGGNSTNMTIDQITHYELDPREESFRTTRGSLDVISLGQVGIQGELYPTSGRRNANYSYYIRPYTTSRDPESGVIGTFMIPYNNDEYGGAFSGDAYATNIAFLGRDDITVYLHNEHQYIMHPNQVDIGANEWREWNGSEQDLRHAGTVLFEIENPIESVNENIEIRVDIQTQDNEFGDVYAHRSRLNSDSNFGVSPQTIIERFRIVPDAEIGLEHIRIDTQRAENGLIADLQFRPVIHRAEGMNQPFTFRMYETTNEGEIIQEVTTWETTFYESPQEIELPIDSTYTDIDQSKRYEVRIEDVDTSAILVNEEADRINTLGYTAAERNIPFDLRELTEQEFSSMHLDELTYEHVIRTERAIGEEMQEYKEFMTLHPVYIEDTKSGYGLPFEFALTYRNELGVEEESISSSLYVQEEALDGDYETTVLNDPFKDHELSFKHIPLDFQPANAVEQWTSNEIEGYTQGYELPESYVVDNNGIVLTKEEYEYILEHNLNQHEETIIHAAGRQFFIPIWIDELGDYDVVWETNSRIGISQVSLQAWNSFDVYAYMYAHMDSETLDRDAILISPVDLINPFPEGIPDEWTEDEINWLQNNIN